jgi:hypothetical protein
MIKIIFMVAFVGSQGPMQGDMKEKAQFATEAECKTFGDHMTPRVADWVRGRLGADWDFPVAVQYKCDSGEPA